MKKSLFVGIFSVFCIGFFIEDIVVPEYAWARRWTNRSKEVETQQYDSQGRLILRSHERRDNQPRGGVLYGGSYYPPAPVYHYPPLVRRAPRCEDYIGPSHPDYYYVCGRGLPGHGHDGYGSGVGSVLSPELTIFCLFCVQPSPPIIRERVVEERPVILERERVVYRDREVAPASVPTPEPKHEVRCLTTCFYVSGGSEEARNSVIKALLDRSYTVLQSPNPDAHEVRVADKVVGDPTAIITLTLIANGQIKGTAEGRAVYKGGELARLKAIAKAADEAVGKL